MIAYKLLRKRNVKKILWRIRQHKEGEISYSELLESYQGWSAYAKWADTYKLRKSFLSLCGNEQ